jgi:hypothetical protein
LGQCGDEQAGEKHRPEPQGEAGWVPWAACGFVMRASLVFVGHVASHGIAFRVVVSPTGVSVRPLE